MVDSLDSARDILIGHGYQEVMSPILSNKELLFEKMNVKEFGLVEIEKFMSERYSVVRNWILPVLLDVLSKNKHVEYPQKVFEQGLVTVRKEDKVFDYERIALVSAHNTADYTEARQVLDSMLSLTGFEYKIVPVEHDSFIAGRVGRVIVNDKKVGYIGEISPKVLSNFGLEVPVAGFEVNLTELFETLTM
jgi:phenylalanyl-tRNA synthetase beta chain